MTRPIVRARRWKRVEYERLELLDGLLMVREPPNAPHATAVRAVQSILQRAFGNGWDVRPQLPIALDDDSEPEPDVSVVPGSFRDYREAHPSRPVLVVEVADATLATDRRKGGLYARAGVPDYWIVNLVDEALEVYRVPISAESSRFGWSYAETRVLRRGDAVSPLAIPAVSIEIADLLG